MARASRAPSPQQQRASGRRQPLAPVSAAQANADAGAQGTPVQPAAAARTPPSAAVDSPDEPRASPAPAPAPRQRGPAPELSRQQQQYQRKQFGAHYAALEEAKAEARQTAAEMLDTIRETPAPKAGKARFGAADVRWQLIKELLKGIGEGTDDEPGDPAMLEQMTTDMAELCELGSAPPAMDGAETDDGVETEPEPAVEAPPASDAEEEEESSEEEEDRPCRSRRARSVSSAQPTQSTSRASKQPRSTSSSAGSRRGNAPCPRPKRSASRTASAGAPAPKRGGKKK